MNCLAPTNPAALRDAEDADILFITSSRAHPHVAIGRKTGVPVMSELDQHLAVDPRAPFHWWLDSMGANEPVQVRPLTHVVLPDGCPQGVDLVAARLEVLCVSGWYGAGDVGLVGSPLLQPSCARRLEAFLQTRKRPILLGPWDFGSPYAGGSIERLVREFRGEHVSSGPANRFMVGNALNTVQALRQALTTAGFPGHPNPQHGSWTVQDQTALLLFQTALRLPVSGWPDLITTASIREAASTRHVTQDTPFHLVEQPRSEPEGFPPSAA